MKFDQVRGYGFVSNDAGGDDIFLHVNDLDFDKHQLIPGSVVEFEVEDSPRGPKAFSVSLVRRGENTAPSSAPRSATAGDEDVLCDFLPTGEYSAEVTEALLTAAPGVTAQQVVDIRRAMIALARGHGWLDD